MTAAEVMPEWIHDLAADFDLPEWVWRTEHVRAACEAGLPPHMVYRELLKFSGLAFGPRSTLLWLSTYCGGKDKPAGRRTHCWPKQEQLAQRSGAGIRAVREHLNTAEERGWVVIERHGNVPSDYWLAIPDLPWCPCGCEADQLQRFEDLKAAPYSLDPALFGKAAAGLCNRGVTVYTEDFEAALDELFTAAGRRQAVAAFNHHRVREPANEPPF